MHGADRAPSARQMPSNWGLGPMLVAGWAGGRVRAGRGGGGAGGGGGGGGGGGRGGRRGRRRWWREGGGGGRGGGVGRRGGRGGGLVRLQDPAHGHQGRFVGSARRAVVVVVVVPTPHRDGR